MFVSPMLLETAPEPFDSESHIFEPKIDGHRMIYSRTNEEVRLYTRHGNDVTKLYPELLDGIGEDVILDGEVAQADRETGTISFEALNRRFQIRRPENIAAAAGRHPVSFIAFDILQYRGSDLRMLPLMRRKEILAELAIDNPNLSVIPFIEERGIALFDSIRERQMEGIVAKEKSSRYSTGRRVGKWQKIINWTYVDVVITGYRTSEFGLIAAIPQDDGELRPAGIIQFGMSSIHKKAFYGVCKSIESGSYKDVVHLEPLLRAKVKTRNVLRNGLLRDPVFVDFLA